MVPGLLFYHRMYHPLTDGPLWVWNSFIECRSETHQVVLMEVHTCLKGASVYSITRARPLESMQSKCHFWFCSLHCSHIYYAHSLMVWLQKWMIWHQAQVCECYAMSIQRCDCWTLYKIMSMLWNFGHVKTLVIPIGKIPFFKAKSHI